MIATDGVTIVKFGKLGNWDEQHPEQRDGPSKIGKFLVMELAMQDWRTIASVLKKERQIHGYDDITRKELPWSAGRPAREQELYYLRNFGVYQLVSERTAITQRSKWSRCRSYHVS